MNGNSSATKLDVDPIRLVGGAAVARRRANACQVTGPAMPSASSSCDALERQQGGFGAGPKRPSISPGREAGVAQALLQQLDVGAMGTAAKNQ